MRSKLSILLAGLALLALPQAAPARPYVPPQFFGISPQNVPNEGDYELMQESRVESLRLPLPWSASRVDQPIPRRARAGGRSMPRRAGGGARDEGDALRRRTRPPWVAAAAGVEPLRLRLAAPGLGGLPAQRREPLRRPRHRSGAKIPTCPTCRFAPGRSGTRRTSSPSAAPTRGASRGCCGSAAARSTAPTTAPACSSAASSAGRCRSRPTSARETSSRGSTAPATSSRSSTASRCTPTSPTHARCAARSATCGGSCAPTTTPARGST